MANNFAAKSVDGQLPNAKGTLYTTPASTTSYVKTITLANTAVGAQTVTLYKKGTGTSRVIGNYTLNQNDVTTFDESIVLNAGDLIEGVTTDATAVDFTISLVEET